MNKSNISYLTDRGHISRVQSILAKLFVEGKVHDVHPVTHSILTEALVDDVALTIMETDRGWPIRSAKAIIATLLSTLTPREPIPVEDCSRHSVDPVEHLKFICGDEETKIAATMQKYKITRLQARIFLILEAADGRVLSKDAIFNRLYGLLPDCQWPEIKIIDFYVHKLRAAGITINTVWGVGYSLPKGVA